jgi:hypothetical protein
VTVGLAPAEVRKEVAGIDVPHARMLDTPPGRAPAT